MNIDQQKDLKCHVLKKRVENNDKRFLFWDEKKLDNVKNFAKPNEHLDIKFSEFVDIIDAWSPEDNEL
jgi:hypothetical protein